MALRIILAGQVALETEHGRIDAGGLGRLGRLALAYLASERRRPVPRDELADALWGDQLPRSWETSLRVVVSRLRTWLGTAGLDSASVLTSAFGCYQLHLPEATQVDVEQAAADLDAARAALAGGDAPAALAAALAAKEVAEGAFLPGGSEPWVERRQAELRRLRVEALEVLADAALATGEYAASLPAADEAAALEPLRESAYVRVMRAHAAAGNRGAALRAYERCRTVLLEELGVSPSPATEAAYLALLQEGTDQSPTAVPGPAPAPWAPSLPAGISSFVGRSQEVAEVSALVQAHRLVTLLGTGGVGKTRLALEVAADRKLLPEFADGAALLPLAEVSDSEDVPAAAARALGVSQEVGRSPTETLEAALAPRQVLLVVDNCEHVVATVAGLVEGLLRRCPRLTVLATSREPLGVAGEVAWQVPSLARADGVRLFVERAQAADARFRAEDAGREAIEAVVDRLDGIPLAIELAAARVPLLSVDEIAARLDDRFALLTGGARTDPSRHHTLRAAIDWSYDGLPPGPRLLLHRLAVFAGSFTLDAAERVAGADLDELGTLVSRSLVLTEPGTGGPTRYRLLETIRAYGAEKLEESGEGRALRSALATWAVELAEEAATLLDGPDQVRWLDQLEAELPNLRAVLATQAGGGDGDDRPLRLATALARFWEVRGHFEEGRRALRRLLDESGAAAPPVLRARAQYAAGVLAQRQGDYAAARSRYEESLAIRRGMGDRFGAAVSLHGLASLAALERDLTGAGALYEESAAIGRALGELDLVGAALANLGWVAHTGGDFAAAQGWYEEALGIRRELGDIHGVALVLGHLGDLAYQKGEFTAAAALQAESLELRTQLGDRAGRADSLATLGHLAIQAGDLVNARAHLEESLALRRDLGDRAGLPGALCNLADLALLSGELDQARAHLEEAEAAAAAGRDHPALAHVLLHQARLARAEGDLVQAAKRYAQARDAAGRLGTDALTAEWLEGVGGTVAAARDPLVGARLLGAAASLRRSIQALIPPHERSGFESDVAAARTGLGRGFDRAWAEGEQLALDQAVAEAEGALRRL
jgi:predicted ATPase/DNA-binding SARP family transcriptional activator/Tfp pilus assembly protein PilF